MYRGHRYYISARQLGTTETKEDSVQAANQWWRDRQAELDYAHRANQRKPEPMEDVAAASLGVAPDLFGNVRHLLEQALLREEGERKAGKPLTPAAPLHVGPDDDIVIEPPDMEDAETIRRREVMGLLEKLLFGEDAKLPPSVADQLPPARTAQIERGVKEIKGEAVADPDRVVQAQVKAWLDMLHANVSAKSLTPGSARYLRICVGHFAAFVGETADVAVIDTERLDAFYRHCLTKIALGEWSVTYARIVFAKSRAWIRWLAERGIVPLPMNISSRSFRFGSAAKKIETWTVEEVRRVIAESPARIKLTLLLMANCGFTQQDVSDLADNEVDWRAGRIIRKRSKTGDRDSTPTVNYSLWPMTFALLQEHRSGGATVLLTKSGRSYLREEMRDGKAYHVDTLRAWFQCVQKRLDFHKPMKQLRKTAATLLESHEVYGRFTSLFLGHSPSSMKDRHYAAPPQALFDEAVTWLGQQFGFVEKN